MNDKSLQIIANFEGHQQIYEKASVELQRLVETILLSKNIHYHSITSRCKDLESLKKKILTKEEKYFNINELTDLIGIRIITYYSDDVDIVSNIIEEEFNVDEENSIDKRAALDPDRFGYLSLHYVLSLKEERTVLPEYKYLEGIKFEIQIRTILQHTWAEIEHNLGYKNNISLPSDFRRDFSRLAGLLEIADKEFLEIRTNMEKYIVNIEEKIKKNNIGVEINKITLKQFLMDNETVRNINHEMMTQRNDHRIRETASYDTYMEQLHDDFNIISLDQLENLLIKHKTLVLQVNEIMMGKQKNQNSMSYITVLYYLFYAIFIAEKNYNKIEEMLSDLGGTRHPKKDIKEKMTALM